MKPSHRNLTNATAKAERRAKGKPPVSKYERKTLAEDVLAKRLAPRGQRQPNG